MSETAAGLDIVQEIGGIKTAAEATRVFESKMSPEHLARLGVIKNPDVLLKIANAILMCEPDEIYVNTGSAEDLAFIRQMALDKGEEAPLPMAEHTIHYDLSGEQGRIVVNARWRDRIAEALHQVTLNRPGLLSGATPGEITLARSGGAPALRLEFSGPMGTALVLWLQDADLPIKTYLRNNAVALWADGSTPLEKSWMEDVVRLVARVGERLVTPRQRPTTSGRGARPRTPESRSGE